MMTMPAIELTRFRVAAGHRDALLAARPAMLRDFAEDRAGFLGATLVELPGGEWLDVVRWRSREDFAASREKGPNRPGIAAFFAAIDELVSAEQGVEAQEPDLGVVESGP
jgi:quinol monooxygenase YgiN